MGLPEPPELGASALRPGSFEGHVAVVTGGGTGLGKAMALEFGRLGAAVVVMSRKEEHLAAGVEALEKLGARALSVQADIRQPDQIAAAFDTVEKELGLPATLVNNAAGNFPVPAEDLSPNGWKVVVEIVLNGTFFCSREFGRRHIAAGTPGSIINIGASYAWTGGPGFAHSSAAKAGVRPASPSPPALVTAAATLKPVAPSGSFSSTWRDRLPAREGTRAISMVSDCTPGSPIRDAAMRAVPAISACGGVQMAP